MSIPNAVLKRLHVDAAKEIAKRDRQLLDGLTNAGFALDAGPDESGFIMKYFQRGGGYYIDVGRSQLTADGKIKVKQGQEITKVKENGLEFGDGTFLEADEIVFAKGFSNMRFIIPSMPLFLNFFFVLPFSVFLPCTGHFLLPSLRPPYFAFPSFRHISQASLLLPLIHPG